MKTVLEAAVDEKNEAIRARKRKVENFKTNAWKFGERLLAAMLRCESDRVTLNKVGRFITVEVQRNDDGGLTLNYSTPEKEDPEAPSRGRKRYFPREIRMLPDGTIRKVMAMAPYDLDVEELMDLVEGLLAPAVAAPPRVETPDQPQAKTEGKPVEKPKPEPVPEAAPGIVRRTRQVSS